MSVVIPRTSSDLDFLGYVSSGAPQLPALQNDVVLAPPVASDESATKLRTRESVYNSFVGGPHAQNFAKLGGGYWTHERSREVQREQQAKRNTTLNATGGANDVPSEQPEQIQTARWRKVLPKVGRQRNTASNKEAARNMTATPQTPQGIVGAHLEKSPGQDAAVAPAMQTGVKGDETPNFDKLKAAAIEGHNKRPFRSLRSLTSKFSRKNKVEAH